MNDSIQLILFISILLIVAIITNFIRKHRNNIIKFAKYKYITKGSLLIIFGSFLSILCLILWYLFVQDHFFGKETVITDNMQSLSIFVSLLILTSILSIFGIIKGISYIRNVIPKEKLYGAPFEMKVPFNVSRFRYIYAACLNPFDMSFRTAFALYILMVAAFILFINKTDGFPEKLLIIFVTACFQFFVKPIVIFNVNKLYNSNKNAAVITEISSKGIARRTNDMLVDITSWDKVECVKYFKDYVVICSDYLDYIIFTNNDIEKNNIKLFYQLSRNFSLSNETFQEKTFVETEEILKGMLKNSIILDINEDKKLKPSSTKIGGNPYLPLEFSCEYPAYFDENDNKRPFVYIAQINCNEIYKLDNNKLLPESGMLYFFCDSESLLGYVYYYDGDLSELKEFELPYDDSLKLNEYSISVSNHLTLPDYEDFGLLYENGYFFDTQLYYGVLNSIYKELKIPDDENLSAGRMLGYACLVDESIIEKAIISDLDQPYTEYKDDEIQKMANGWILLFQCNYEKATLYFYIKTDDLKKRNFNNVYFTYQI